MHTTYFKIADLIIKIAAQTDYIDLFCEKYKVEESTPDIDIILTNELLEAEQKYNSRCTLENIRLCEYTASLRQLNEKLSYFDGFILHSSAICADGKGIAFCAISGTGKTTHTILWEKLLKNRMKIINGDKPIVRFIDGVPYVFGSPWSGKEKFDNNTFAKLTDICFIERSDTNEVLSIDKSDAVQRLSKQIAAKNTPMGILKNAEFMEDILNKCKLHIIKCNMDIEAAEIAYKAIFGKEP